MGVLLTQYFHRQNRVETYSHKIFERRLEVYESLMALLQSGSDIASEVMENEQLSSEKRHTLISEVIMSIASFVDEHSLYIDKYVAGHMVATFMGAEDVLAVADENERAARVSTIHSSYSAAKEIVLAESGAERINKHFRDISRSNPSSKVIEKIKYFEKGGV